MPIKASHWFESLSNAITDGKVADLLRAKIDLIESQRDDAVLRADKLALRIGELESDNLELRQEVSNLRKAIGEQRRIDDQSHAILKHLFDHDADFTADSIASAFRLQVSVVKYHFDELFRLGLITQGSSEPQPYQIGREQPWSKPTVRVSAPGRKHIVKATA
jgi:hypothetical protein